MDDSELQKQHTIFNQYLLIGNEPLLMDRTVNTIKEALKVDESFDYETFSISETPLEEILPKLYLNPFASARRLIVIKNLEELESKALATFAKTINAMTTHNCCMVTYRTEKEDSNTTYTKVATLFTKAVCVTYKSDKATIRKWIMTKMKRDNIRIPPPILSYLENEFSNDITGLKNEFDKIENYLGETQALSVDSIKDLAKGVCDFDKYFIANAFLRGDKDVLNLFEELEPYIHSQAEIVYALTNVLIGQVRRSGSFDRRRASLMTILEDIARIDRGVKRSSQFTHLMVELFFLKHGRHFRKGAIYG